MPSNKKSGSRKPATSEKKKSSRSQKKEEAPPRYSVDTDNEDEQDDRDEEISASESDHEVPVKTKKKQQKGKQPAATTETAKPELKEDETKVTAFSLLMNSMKNIGSSRVKVIQDSSFVPSCHIMYEILSAMHNCTADNTYIYRTNQHYHPLLSRLYYGILFWIQVLRAKRAANQESSFERNFLRNIDERYPFETLPVAGPLVGYFSTIAAHMPADPKFEQTYVYPTTPDFLNDCRIWTMPHIPALIYAIKTMQNVTEANFVAKAGPSAAHQDSVFVSKTWRPYGVGVVVPDIAENTTTYVFGERITATDKAVAAPNQYQFEHTATSWYKSVNPAINTPLTMANSTLIARKEYLEQVKLPAPKANIQDVEDFLGLEECKWFEKLVDIASTEASYFKGTSNFSEVDTISGPAITVTCKGFNAKKQAEPTSFYGSEVFVPDVKGYSRVSDISIEDFNRGLFAQLHYTTPTLDTLGDLDNMGSSRVNDEDGTDYPPFFDIRMNDYERKSDTNSITTGGILALVRRELFHPKGAQ
nr:capsid protein [Sarcosphaera coronaria partitivirus]